MENSPVEKTHDNKETLVNMLAYVAANYNDTQVVKTLNAGYGNFTIDRNTLSKASSVFSSPELRHIIRSIDPNSTMRKVQALINADMSIGTALFAEAAVVIAAYMIEQDSSEENLERLTNAVLKLQEIRQS